MTFPFGSNLDLLLRNDFIYTEMSMFYFDFLLLTAVYLGIEIPTDICEGHHYQKRYFGPYGP